MSNTDETILVTVAGPEASAHALDAAIDRADRENGSLVVLHVMPNRLYEARQRSATSSPDLTYDGLTFTRTQATEMAQRVAERAATAAIGDRAIPFTAVGRVGGLVSTVIAVAAVHDCETIMLPEIDSWWGRTLGRADRKIARRFDGTVIRVPEPPPVNLKSTEPVPEA